MAVRCFLFRYSKEVETLRWLDCGRDDRWAQQVLVMRLPDGQLQHTGDDPNAKILLSELMQRLSDAEGNVEEL